RGSRVRSRRSRGRRVSASGTTCRRSRQPARSSISAPCVSRTLTTPLPTVPRPRRPILISFMAGADALLAAPSAGGEGLEAAEGLPDALLVLAEGKTEGGPPALPKTPAPPHPPPSPLS